MKCSVCGSERFTSRVVLWQQLIDDWQLAPHEVDYVNAQQGQSCDDCGANLRSIALADAIRGHLRSGKLLADALRESSVGQLSILEINEAGSLSPTLRLAPGYVYGAYPAVDMHALPYAAHSFDMVVHSDTLEHVMNPVHALRECWRVLKPGGALCFTVPIIVGRLSRNRAGLPSSYHGNPGTTPADFIVHTEYGVDAWTHVMEAGFDSVHMHSVQYPAAIAIRATKGLVISSSCVEYPTENPQDTRVIQSLRDELAALTAERDALAVHLRRIEASPLRASVQWLRDFNRRRLEARHRRRRSLVQATSSAPATITRRCDIEVPQASNIEDKRWRDGQNIVTNPDAYLQDGLASVHNHEFMAVADFQSAYRRGVQATGRDYAWHWRVHVGLWAAGVASKLPGDFVECGVNAGFLSSSIMHALDWDTLGKTFYLLDTFTGLDERYVNDDERADGILEKNRELIENGFYVTAMDRVEENFSEWKNKKIVPGSIPDTLDRIDSDRIAFAHIDLNCAPPEVASMRHLWPRLEPGGIVLLDDYAYHGYRHQKAAMDAVAAELGFAILSLPTGQGLVIKPRGV